MKRDELLAFMSERDILYCICISNHGETVEELGNVDELDEHGLASQYFLNDPSLIFGFLEGKILPQIVTQGSAVAVICQPAKGEVLGLFTNRECDAVTLYSWANELDAGIKEFWASRGTMDSEQN